MSVITVQQLSNEANLPRQITTKSLLCSGQLAETIASSVLYQKSRSWKIRVHKNGNPRETNEKNAKSWPGKLFVDGGII